VEAGRVLEQVPVELGDGAGRLCLLPVERVLGPPRLPDEGAGRVGVQVRLDRRDRTGGARPLPVALVLAGLGLRHVAAGGPRLRVRAVRLAGVLRERQGPGDLGATQPEPDGQQHQG
jgi:hypothetical protein